MYGYREAAKIDKLIYELYKKEPPCPDNAREWMAYTRTIISGLYIIGREARDILRKGEKGIKSIGKKG